MRRYSIFFLFFLCLTITTKSLGQNVNFQDGFEDGNFSNNPSWTGDPGDFTIVNGTPNYKLKLNASSSPVYLSTPSSNIDGSWKFYIEFRDFEPSGSNQANIFLMSNIANLAGPVSGYAVQVGQSGDDYFKIVRYDNGSEVATVMTDTTVVDPNGAGYTIRVTRSNSGKWSMQVGKGYGGTLYDSGHTGTDNTYTSASYFGPKIDFTSSRSDKFFFDFKIDLPPFITTAAKTSGDKTMDLAFNRPVDQSSVGTNNFSLDQGLGSPTSISFLAADSIRIIYNQSLPSNQYTLSIDGVRDQSGNPIQANDQESITVFDHYTDGNVKINEFMYDPPSGQAEYIEIKNTSNKYLNLANWQVGDDSKKENLSSDPIILYPDSLLVLSADTTALYNTYGHRSYVLANLPSLNNGGDAIRIFTDKAKRVDSLTFTPDWGGSNIALERRSVTTSATFAENWGNSPNPYGGTPGLSNEIPMDATPPKLTSFNIISDHSLKIGFDERLAPVTATNNSDYQITNSRILSAREIAPDTVQLSLGSALHNARDYNLTISGLTDIFGNSINSTDTTFTYYKISPADSGDVAINEFMFAPSNSTEYIELYNHSGKSLNLQHWTLSDNRHNRLPITDTKFVVPPDSFAVLAPDPSLQQDYPDIALVNMGTNFPALNNGGDQIIIRDSNGTLLDSLQYSSTWGGDEVALERKSVTVSGIYSSNWGDSPNGFGTPGRPNRVPSDNTPPFLETFAIRGSRHLALRFSEGLEASSAKNNHHYLLNNGPRIRNITINAADSISLTLASDLHNATDYTLSIKDVNDIFKNTISPTDTSFTFYKVSPADSSDIFINEFSYEPISGSTEYIELYNPTNKSFNLKNWTLSDNRGLKSIITESQFIVPPDSFVVIAPDNSLLSTYPNISLVAMRDFPSLNNSGDNIVVRNAHQTLLDSLQYSSDWGGKEVSLERRTISKTGLYRENWGNSPTEERGTPGRSNKIIKDKIPPRLTSLKINGNQNIMIGFSERLDTKTATNAANYSISNSNVSSVQFLPPDSVKLTLGSVLQNSQKYTLSLSGLEDIFGNIVSSIDTSFTYYKISPADSGDVVINEFMYVPPSGSTEYIELLNQSGKALNLQGWTLSDNRNLRTQISEAPFIIPPHSFAVLAPDNTLRTNYPNISLLSMGSNFPALNNGEDQIIIRDNNGSLIDSLQYSSDWGGNEVALERRTSSITGTFGENWSEAPNGFGTPGSANDVLDDKTPPSFVQLSSPNASTLQLVFSERITQSTATNIKHYNIQPHRGIQLIATHYDSVTLYLDQPMTSGETYKVAVSNISDIFGNTISKTTRKEKFLKIEKAQAGDIVLNEIMYNPAPREADFVELYNTTDKNFNLNNWFIGDATGTSQFNKNITLRSDSYLVLTGDQNFAKNYDNAITVSDFPALNNSREDAVYIQRKDRMTIDSLYYSPSWGGNKEGTSMERKDPLAASNDGSNWETSSSTGTFSAGKKNISYQPDTNPPKIIFASSLSNNDIKVKFNEFIKQKPDLKFSAYGQALKIADFDSTQANIIYLKSQKPKEKSKNLTINVKNLTDVRGNKKDHAEIAVAQPLMPADLVINEILYNPLNKSDDNQPDQSEYIELYNTQDYALSLEGLVLHDAPDEKGHIREIYPVTSTAKWVPAQGYVLIYADDAATQFNKSKVANFFDLGSPDMRSVLRVNRSSLSLASSGNAIFIADSTGTTIDSVYYDKSWQNPNLTDTRGIALERINPDGPSSNQDNWGSSVNPKGGTPNKKNSIYQNNPINPTTTGISFNPNPFSPDGDGYEDNLFINYKLNQQDYLIRARIYDRYGRLVRELANGKPAGFKGQLVWDGRKDDGSRNRIGIYIVVFQAYNSATGGNESFKKTVVLARKLN